MMPLPTGDVIGLMADNMRKRKTVFPISARNATKWARGLDLARGGDTVIYTGHMYQLLPYINASVRTMGLFEDTFFEKFVFMARFFNKIFNASTFIAIPSRSDVIEYNRILTNIARLLKHAGVTFGYLYEAELYAGALAYDLGMNDVFEEHARRVYSMLKNKGVRSVITVDPHTTNMLRSAYPSVIQGYDISVKSYLEVLAERDIEPVNKADAVVVIHDSCVYSRYEGVIEEPRKLLRQAGYTVREPKDSKDMTHCCGGPIESIFPKTANQIGEKRIEQLKDTKAQSATLMCPICLATLRKAAGSDIEVGDISSLLAKVYCDGHMN
jgi:Fe-S oxidoreductase